ncbi:desmocollin 2-like protein isoform X2 [Amia ocellicauda]
MAQDSYNWLCFSFMVFAVSAETCIPNSLQPSVPEKLKAGFIISKVNLEHCMNKDIQLSSDDLDFAVQRDGTISTLVDTSIPPGGRTFTIWFEDQQSGQKWKMDVIMSLEPQEEQSTKALKRAKRRWSPMPFTIKENGKPPFPMEIERIGSDSSQNYSVNYRISGPGVDMPPVGLITVDPKTGMLSVTRPVDREQYPEIIFQARAVDPVTGKDRDDPLPFTVKIEDVNDNAPQFVGGLKLSVPEQCDPDTIVGTINATDRDEVGTPHTAIRYKLLSGDDLFAINHLNGRLITKSTALDREVKDTHTVLMEIRDMNGAPEGLFNTATATIQLTDINDNPPTFSQKSYAASVKENVGQGLILRIPVEDKDLVNTPNWKAKYFIKKGNENAIFRIETEPKTNEGLLYMNKPLDYEKDINVTLEISAENEAKLEHTSATWATVPVNVNVLNEDEGPEFTVPNLLLRVMENSPNGTLIGNYKAIDPETKSSNGIKYSKVSDPGSWINVGETTGDLKVANTIDRESPLVTNGLYNITVKAVDSSQKPATGVVSLYIEDVNDNNPEIQSKSLNICAQNNNLGLTTLEAKDKDGDPFSSPFSFDLGDNQDGKWILKNIKNETAELHQNKELPVGLYTVPVMVKDLQNKGELQTVSVRICKCYGGQCLAERNSSAFGKWGILALLLSLALLLLLCIFFSFACATKKEKVYIDDATDGMLLKSNTEGPGEEMMNPNLKVIPSAPAQLYGEPIISNGSGQGTLNSNVFLNNKIVHTSREMINEVALSDNYNGTAHMFGGNNYMESAQYSETWMTNGLFIDQKLNSYLTEGTDRYAGDIIHSYGFEGKGSLAGSVGCCSDLANEEGLEFLNTLGPKFRTLAEICTKK